MIAKYFKIITSHLFIPIAAGLLVLIFLFRGNGLVQFELVVAGLMFYLVTAFAHHHLDKSLTVEVILEYILIAALVLIILQGLLI